MDWFSWLSKTSLEPSIAYEYGLLFGRNELEAEDLGHFNHEFLQSMGISVAKHRLEILKLARKDVGPAGPLSISKLVLAFKATRNNIKKCVTKWVFFPEQKIKNKEQHQEVLKKQSTRKAKSGPLDTRVKENWMVGGDGTRLKLSGPLDRKAHERLVFAYKSPNNFMSSSSSSSSSNKTQQVPKPLVEGCETSTKKGKERVENVEFISRKDSIPTLWATLFQDMQPT